MVPAPAPAIYQQFDQVEPPQRFLAIIKAYMQLIQASDTTWSYRKLSELVNVSHSYFTNLDARIKQGTGKANIMTVQAIVSAINARVPGDQLWPIEHAMIAAGQQRYLSRVRPVLPIRNTRTIPDLYRNDTLPRTVSRIPAPIIDIQEITERGLGDAVTMREVVNLSNNMAFIKGRVPGYVDQHTGEWVLIQSVEGKPGQTEWVLVREEGSVKAVQRQTVTPQQHIIAWILGIMRITG